MLYDKLVETAKAQAAVVTPEEESDMEASDVEDDVPNVNSDSLPLGTTFRTIHVLQNQTQNQANLVTEPKPTFMPRKLSTISSQDRESIPNIEEEKVCSFSFSDLLKKEDSVNCYLLTDRGVWVCSNDNYIGVCVTRLKV